MASLYDALYITSPTKNLMELKLQAGVVGTCNRETYTAIQNVRKSGLIETLLRAYDEKYVVPVHVAKADELVDGDAFNSSLSVVANEAVIGALSLFEEAYDADTNILRNKMALVTTPVVANLLSDSVSGAVYDDLSYAGDDVCYVLMLPRTHASYNNYTDITMSVSYDEHGGEHISINNSHVVKIDFTELVNKLQNMG